MSLNTLFADSLLETSWGHRSRRSLTTLTSFALEAVALVLLLLFPLWKTVGMPSAHTLSTPISLGQRAPEPLAAAPRSGASSMRASNSSVPRFLEPSYIPIHVLTGIDDPAPQPISGGGLGTAAGPGIPDGILPGGGTMPVPVAPRPAPVARAVRTSVMQEGNLVHRVIPTYPYPAKMARVEGLVLLSAIISKDGTIENLQVIKGHPLLVPAAIDAVKQWRYRPYILNHEPVEVETQIAVNFTLSGN
jgi:protein TonB